uniref:G-protein coupled receptors family 1 profile domain-containing protein n=1 Tax=Electrophorus electricus TaxID=8005 RepID=A0AAY5EBP2_ELEEL
MLWVICCPTMNKSQSLPVFEGNIFVVSLSVVDRVVPTPVCGFIMGLGSVFNIMAIAINHYCYICHILHYDQLYISSCYTISVVVVHFLIQLLMISFFYIGIWVFVIHMKHQVKPGPWMKVNPSDLHEFLTIFMFFFVLFCFFLFFAVCSAPLNFIGLVVTVRLVRMAPQYKTVLLFLCIPQMFLLENSRLNTEALKRKPSAAISSNNLAEIHYGGISLKMTYKNKHLKLSFNIKFVTTLNSLRTIFLQAMP